MGHLGLGGQRFGVKGPGGKVVTTAVVTAGNTPYTALGSDDLIEFDNSAAPAPGAQLAGLMPPAPTVGERHTWKWWKWFDGTSPMPTVAGNGHNIEPWGGSVGGSALVATTSIGAQGGQGTWEYDGTQWVLVA